MDSAKFMAIPPRYQRALEMLRAQRLHDPFGAIGKGAMRDEDDVFTLEQIVDPLFERGLIEDLTWTDLKEGGKYFVRLTQLGDICLSLGYMLRETRKVTLAEMRYLAGPEAITILRSPTMGSAATAAKLAEHDASEEKEAIA
jgi:hypothetical protein